MDKIIDENYDAYDTAYGLVIKDSTEFNGLNMLGIRLDKLFPDLQSTGGEIKIERKINLDLNDLNIVNKNSINHPDLSLEERNYLIVTPLSHPNMNNGMYSLGESVMIKFIDNDIKTPILEPYGPDNSEMRNTDRFSISVASKTTNKDVRVKDNSYFLDFDSVNQKVQLHLSKTNGEKSQLDIIADAASGMITLTDGSMLSLGINSEEDTVIANTKAGSTLQLTGNKLYIFVDDVEMVAKNSISMKTNMFNITSSTLNVNSSNMNITSSSYINNSSKYKVVTNSATIKSSGIATIDAKSLFLASTIIGCKGPILFPAFSIGTCLAPPDLSASKTGVGGDSVTGLNMKPGGTPAADAQNTILALNAIAAFLAPFGGSAVVNAFTPMIPKTKLKG